MATTKVINDLIDLNQTGNTTALKGCKGDNANQPQTPTVSVDYLVVAGGGGGGGYGQAGAGGAGGFLDGTIVAPNNTEINIVVGLGGAGGTGALPATGINGQDSGFYTIQSQGGGGSQAHTYGGLPGGSGGGSATLASVGFTGGSGVSGQGNAGGTAVAANYLGNPYSGSGGGGAGTAGTGGNNVDGDGGRGKTTTIITTANASTANVGQNSGLLNVTAPAFAGGGGGGAFGATCGDGGDGGGGDGNIGNSVYPLANNGYSGTTNTGGGGGGVGSYGPDTNRAGNGGSGVVILKYANADVSNVTISGSLIGGINPVDNSAVVDFPAGTGCQALYQFENNTDDSTDNNYDPTSEANISFPTSSPAPKFGTYSLYMNGSSSYVNGIPQTLATTLRTAGLFTFSMWINPIAAPSGLADFIRFIDNIYVRILINSDLTLGYVVIPVAGTYIEPPLTTSVARINLNEWSHVCLTGSVANGIKFYINGQQEAYNPAWVGTFMTYTDTNYKTNGLNGSSGLPGNANQVMNGNIDNFRVYNQELSSSQVLQLAYMNIDTKFDDGTNTTLVFKSGTGTINLTGSSVLGPKVGDLRTNEDQTSGGSASAMEHFMSTGWRIMSATNAIPDLLKDASYHYNPKTITSDGAISSWADTGSINRAVYPSAFNSGSWSKVGTGQSIEYVSQPYTSYAKSLLAGSANMTPYSDYNSQQDYTVGGFYWIPNDYITNYEYPWLMNLQSRTTTVGYSTSPGGPYDYYDCLNFYSYRAGVSGGKSHNLVPEFYANGSGVGGGNISGGKPTGFQTWQMLTMTVNWGSPTIIKTHINGVVQDTISTSISGLGATSNSLGIGSSYYRQIRGGLYFGDQFGFMGTVKTASELVSIYNNYKVNYGL